MYASIQANIGGQNENSLHPTKKKAHFATCSEDLDDITTKTNTNNTHAQTRWAVRVSKVICHNNIKGNIKLMQHQITTKLALTQKVIQFFKLAEGYRPRHWV